MKSETKHKTNSRLIFWVMAAGLLSGLTAGGFLALTHDLPQIQSLEDYTPSAVTRVYSADQVLLTELFDERRDLVPLDQIPKALVTALLATEDRRFYEHSGIAVRGILRAIVKNIRKGRYAEGASTLTQQLSKTLFLTPRKTLIRKFREAILALQLERRYTKDEILELYLNQIYLGSGAYGVGAAARIYFGKSVDRLTLAECALVAGLPKSPSRYSPLNNPELAQKRRNTVLRQMQAVNAIGQIDQQAFEEALQEPIITVASGPQDQKAPYFVEYIKKQLEAAVGVDLMYKGGLTVNTTLQYQLQEVAEEAVRRGLASIDARMPGNGITAAPPQAALVALQNRTGAIIAMIGGRGDHLNLYNRATLAQRQPGSAFKPIVFALAIEQGFQQTDTLLDAPIVFQRPFRDDDWQPENFSKSYDGEVSLRWALIHSKNIPAVRLIEKIGPSAVVQFAHDLGLSSDLRPDLSLALGSYEVNLLELTNAYGVFANEGQYIAAYGLAEVLDADGKPIWRPAPHQRIVMSPVAASITTDMLTAVIEDGTGRRARHMPGPLAGKTGTTDDFKDALFIGYSPTVACGVWVGNDAAASLGPGETGARAALPIWMDFMSKALQGQPQQYFDIPNGVRKIRVDPKSGNGPPGHPGAAQVLVRSGIN